MKKIVVRTGFVVAFAIWAGVVRVETQAPVVRLRSGAASAGQVPRLLSETGLYMAGQMTIDPRNRPFTPQYPLWSDGAAKRRWVRLPENASIDATNIDRWDFPVGTKFWKEFEFAGRKVETRFLWKVSRTRWVFASYAWNEEQTRAVRVPETGLANIAEVAPGKRHSIPSVTECRACHDSARTEILGFSALQLSTDRDPLAPHAETSGPEMVTLETLVNERRVVPARTEWIASPPRIAAADARTRAALGYLSANCGSCHNSESSIASVGLSFKHLLSAGECAPAMVSAIGNRGHWVVPSAPDGESRIISAGRPDLSALIARAKSRRGASQMPPIGTVVVDREGVELLTAWVESLGKDVGSSLLGCRPAASESTTARTHVDAKRR